MRSLLPARAVAWLPLGLVLTVVVLAGAGRASAAFGDSHDGYNAGVWVASGAALTDDGLVESRLGARTTVDGEVRTYAHHPPLISLEEAIAQTVLGRSPLAARAPAWLGSLAAVVLLARLGLVCGVARRHVAIGLAGAVACPMFAVYGAMLDTPMIALPWAAALLLGWQRARSGGWHPWGLAGVAAVTCLASWQGVLLASVLAGAAWWLLPRRHAAALAVGWSIGTAGLGGWLLWASGSFADLGLQLSLRTGEGSFPVGWGDLANGQLGDSHVWAGLPIALGLPALLLSVLDRRTRPVGAAAAASVIGYTLAMRNGAYVHDYWTFWGLLPLAIGGPLMAERFDGLLRRYPRPLRLAVPVALLVLGAFVGVVRPSTVGGRVERGAAAGELVTRLADGGRLSGHYAGEIPEPANWLSLATDRPAVRVATAADARALAIERPTALVVVRAGTDLFPTTSGGPCRRSFPAPTLAVGDFVAVEAEQLADIARTCSSVHPHRVVTLASSARRGHR